MNVEIYKISIIIFKFFFQILDCYKFWMPLVSAFWCQNCLHYNLENDLLDLECYDKNKTGNTEQWQPNMLYTLQETYHITISQPLFVKLLLKSICIIISPNLWNNTESCSCSLQSIDHYLILLTNDLKFWRSSGQF